MSLIINNNMLSQFSFLSLTISFLLFSPKTLSFSRRPPNLSSKNDDLGLVHRWIVVKFENYVCNLISRILTVENFVIMFYLREITFAL